MYHVILLILYLLVLIPSIKYLVRGRDIPSIRRLSAGIGVAGVLVVPSIAAYLSELLTYIIIVGFLLMIILLGIGLALKSIFR